jgi:ZIP family zinc transporter
MGGGFMHNALAWTTGGLMFVLLMTMLGSSTVYLIRDKDVNRHQSVFLGFAAGVMIAASVWSLLIPAIEEVEAAGGIGWIPAAIGFLIGALFLMGLDRVIPHFHQATGTREGRPSASKRTLLLFSAVTLHNIPEGMAVGLAVALAAQTHAPGAQAAAIALAIGIGIQNFPEGAAVTLPFRQEGYSRSKSFLLGSLTGVVEPVFGAVAALLASFFTPIMPWLLAFAAGAMIYVVVDEIIPEAQLDEHSNKASMGVIAGFMLMMILDVALG